MKRPQKKGVRTIFRRKRPTGTQREPSRETVLTPFFVVGILLIAAGLRLTSLDNRPMHCDEAVHAIKFGRLLESDDYVYNPHEYHGPSLNFLTLPIARLASARKLTEITETHLRLLPAVFGIVLVGLVWAVRDELGRPAALCAAGLTAVSPAMVFYSRYYIQEMLLVCFTFGAMVALWRWRRAEKVSGTFYRDGPSDAAQKRFLTPFLWLVLLGLCVGMMHASKETCVIAIAAMAAGMLGPAIAQRANALSFSGRACPPLRSQGVASFPRNGGQARPLNDSRKRSRLLLRGLLVVLPAAGVSALLFSSLLDNPHGVVDSYTTYFHYLGRASGEGTAGRHFYPPDYYFRVLFWWHRPGGPLWTEASIAVLSLVGLVPAVLGKGLGRVNPAMVRFLAVYTLLMTLVYSALPYKTPWCALGFFHAMILLAGVGAAVLVRAAPGYAPKALVVALLVAATGHLAWQAHRASFVAYDDPTNPYVYAHTTRDVPVLARRVEQIAAFHPDGRSMHVQVICPDDDFWPLPWYLRMFSRVGWFSRVPKGPPAPLIITQPKLEPSLSEYLYEKQPPGQRYLYVPIPPDQEDRPWQLRPHVPLRPYVRLDLWEAYLGSKRRETQ